MKKSKIKIFHSHESAQKDYEDEIFSMSPEERVSLMEHLRRQYFIIKNKPIHLKMVHCMEIDSRRT